MTTSDSESIDFFGQTPAPSAPVEPPLPPVPAPAQTGERIDLGRAGAIVGRINEAYRSRVVGQEALKTVLLTSLLTGGHVLLESLPGLAKTTAAKALADSISASFKRIQCTPDLLPSDIIGTQIYNQQENTFETRKGPIHANFVLLDEINRSSAKTQSATLEAMQEKQTTIGGENYPLPKPFMLIATQNPIEQEGTYRLPEAQLDRFLMKETLTYPTPEEERLILTRIESGSLEEGADLNAPTTSVEDLLWLQQQAREVFVAEPIYEYILNIVYATRHIETILGEEGKAYVQYGASPRASIAFLKAVKSYALLQGRDFVIPEDVKDLAHPILRHRVVLTYEGELQGLTPVALIDRILELVKTP